MPTPQVQLSTNGFSRKLTRMLFAIRFVIASETDCEQCSVHQILLMR